MSEGRVRWARDHALPILPRDQETPVCSASQPSLSWSPHWGSQELKPVRFRHFQCLICGSHQQRLKENLISTCGSCLLHWTCTNSSQHHLAAGEGALLPADYDFNEEGLLGWMHLTVLENLVYIPALCILLKINQSLFCDWEWTFHRD